MSIFQATVGGGRHAQVIYNCLPERNPDRDSDAPLVDTERFNVVYLGRIRPEKGVRILFDVALDIVRTRDDVVVWFVGENHWQNPFAESLLRHVQEESLSERLRFLGEIEDVPGLLSRCQLHVCPSMVESFGLTVLEAKSQGVPSVVFPTGGLRETVTHLVDGFICRSRSKAALNEGVHYFLENPCARHSAGEAARESLARFGRRRISAQWTDVFRPVIAQRSATSSV